MVDLSPGLEGKTNFQKGHLVEAPSLILTFLGERVLREQPPPTDLKGPLSLSGPLPFLIKFLPGAEILVKIFPVHYKHPFLRWLLRKIKSPRTSFSENTLLSS